MGGFGIRRGWSGVYCAAKPHQRRWLIMLAAIGLRWVFCASTLRETRSPAFQANSAEPMRPLHA
jgi:hypothetical protein